MAVLRVAVGSTNPVKTNAVQRAFAASFPEDEVQITGYAVPSGVADQPWGDEETRRGAMNRAEAALAAGGGESAFAVGLEGGCGDCAPDGVDCFAYMAVRRRDDGQWGVARTASFALPPRLARLIRGLEPGHPKMELGDADDLVFADVNSKQKGGIVSKVTRGAIDRTEYYVHALHCALCPFLHDGTGLYGR